MVTDAYRAPETVISASPERAGSPISPAEWRAFAGEADSERRYYSSAWAGERPLPRFHWPAFWVGTLWCFYRRLVALGFLLLVLETLAVGLSAAAVSLLMPQVLSDLVTAQLAGMVGVLVVRVPFAALANGLYHQRARRAIEQVRAIGAEGRSAPTGATPEFLSTIEARGGTRVLAVWIYLVGNLAVQLATALAAGLD